MFGTCLKWVILLKQMQCLALENELDFFSDTLENVCDTQMCRDTQFENHCVRH
jgi:hypothetical protein